MNISPALGSRVRVVNPDAKRSQLAGWFGVVEGVYLDEEQSEVLVDFGYDGRWYLQPDELEAAS